MVMGWESPPSHPPRREKAKFIDKRKHKKICKIPVNIHAVSDTFPDHLKRDLR